ncbi:hypothetical protein MFLAVUS_005361 [Mucor flavus]|uniref:Transposase n=1 Tax=Mucor flavus TaxID=439312 RepID=A0ABP9YYI3_9FUNG
MQEFEHISIREATSKVGLTKSTAIRKAKEWDELTNGSNEVVIPDTISSKEHRGRKEILQDVHTVVISELLINKPTLTVDAVKDQICETFNDIQITPRLVAAHIKNKRRITYKRIVPQYFARDSEETIIKRYNEVKSWISQNLDFFNDCVFIDEAGFNRNIHR